MKIGILVSEDGPSPQDLEFLEQVFCDREVFDVPLLVQPVRTQSFPGLANGGAAYLWSAFVWKFRKLIVGFVYRFEVAKLKKILVSVDNSEAIRSNFNVPTVWVDVSGNGQEIALSDSSRLQLIEQNVDILINMTERHLTGSLDGIVKRGVLSFYSGDIRYIRGEAPGFWEVYQNLPSTGFTIMWRDLGAEISSVVYRGNVVTQNYWTLNLSQLRRKGFFFLLKMLRQLSIDNEFSVPLMMEVYSIPTYPLPGLSNLVRYLVCTHLTLMINGVISRMTKKKKYNWSVSYVKNDVSGVQMCDAITVKNPPERFFADPFLMEHEGDLYCFVEDYFYSEDKGKISVLKLVNGEMLWLGVALDENFHLSFPFVFKNGKEIYMIPESSRAESIRLYRAKKFPLEWEFVMSLLDGVKAVDTVVFESDERWYLLTNFCSAGIGDNSSELHLYSSESLLSNNWIPAAHNPIIFDSMKARNGGFFISNGRKFRVGQIQGKGHYGRGFTINEIISVGEGGYEEREVFEVLPDFFSGITSTHHYHIDSGYCVFDSQ